MNYRDRVKQTATTSDGLTLDLYAGTADAGYLTFREAYKMSTAPTGAVRTYSDQFLLIERSNGEWQIILAVTSYNPDTLALTATGTFYASSTGAALTFTPSESVTVSLTPSASVLWAVAVGALSPPSLAGHEFDSYSSAYDGLFPRVTASGLLAVGERAYAGALDAIALAPKAKANVDGAINFVRNLQMSSKYSLATGLRQGVNAQALMGLDLVHNIGLTGVSIFTSSEQSFDFDRGILNCHTSNATATDFTNDFDGTVSGTSNAIFCDAGITIFEGDVTAYQLVATGVGDYKVWHVKFAVYTDVDYVATQIIGTPEITELAASAGAATWGVSAVLVSATNNTVSLRATGEAAKNISWGFHYLGKYHKAL